MSETLPGSGPSSEADFELARRAVARGLLTREQVEEAVLAREKSGSARLLDHLPLSPTIVKALESPPAAPPLPPEVAAAAEDSARRIGKYVIVAALGAGGMGVVMKAYDQELRRWVALKFMKAVGDERAKAYFQREARLAAALTHPNVASIFEVGEWEGQPFIAMQYIEGQTLAQARKRMALTDVLTAVASVCDALVDAHGKGLVHRDLKPANVMIDRTGRVFVMDFGLAKEETLGEEASQSIGGSDAVVGTPQYMAPEQAKGKADARSDLYGVGTILYELVTGRPPFVGESTVDILLQVVHQEPVWPRKLSPTTPEDVEAIILHALEKDSKKRYQKADELLEDLRDYKEGRPLRHARVPTLGYILGKKIRRQPLLWGTAAALLLAVVGGSIFGTYWLLRARAEALDKAKVEREERLKTEVERRRANEKLSYSYILRGRQSEYFDMTGASVYYAEANLAHPSALGAANAQRSLAGLSRLIAFLDHGNPVLTLEVGGQKVERENIVGVLAFSPDGKRVATGSWDGTLRLWDSTTGSPAGPPMKHGQSINTLAFSPDGSRVVTGDMDNSGRLWDVERAAPIGALMKLPGGGQVKLVAFTSDGSRVVTWSWDGDVRLWDGRTGEPVDHAGQFRFHVDASAFSRDGKRAVLGSNSGEARLWNVDTGKPFGAPMKHRGSITGVAFSPQGDVVATASIDKTVRFWDAGSGAPLRLPDTTNVLDRSSSPQAVAFSPNGEFFANADSDHTVTLSDWRKCAGTGVRHDDAALSVAFTPDGKFLVSGARDKTLRIWSVPEGNPAWMKMRLDAPVRTIAISPDGTRMATSGPANSACLWSLEPDSSAPRMLQHGESGVSRAVFLGPDRLLTVGGSRAWLWDLKSLRSIRQAKLSDNSIVSMAVSRDGRLAVFGGTDHLARLWNLETLESVGKPMHHEYEWVKAVALSPDGTRLVTGSRKTAQVWDAATGDPVGKPMVHEEWVTAVLFAADGRRVLTSDQSTPARTWDAATGAPLRTLFPGSKAGETAFYSGEGKMVLTSHFALPAHLYDLVRERTLGSPISHDDRVEVARFSPDGRRLAIASGSSVLLVDPVGERRVGKTLNHQSKVNQVTFSPDSRWIATAGDDQQVQLWEAESGEALGRSFQHPGPVGDVAFSPDGRRLVTAGDQARLYDVSFLVDRVSPEAIHLRARLNSGLRLDPFGEIEAIPPGEWAELRKTPASTPSKD